MDKRKLIRIFDRQAVKYDRMRGDAYQRRWRQQLLRHAQGEVLELAVGAGANFPYYSPAIRLTAIDFSPAMVDKAKQAARAYPFEIDVQCADIEEADLPAHAFDTVVSTLSLCSYANPRKVLENMNRWCKPNGQILLMEHGISSHSIVAGIQKLLNPLLYRTMGCHHTRDILKMVRNSGMTIVGEERIWLNMGYLIWAKPG